MKCHDINAWNCRNLDTLSTRIWCIWIGTPVKEGLGSKFNEVGSIQENRRKKLKVSLKFLNVYINETMDGGVFWYICIKRGPGLDLIQISGVKGYFLK